MPLYETHIPVSDHETSMTFYRDVLGLIPAFSQPERGVAFLYIDDAKTGMIGLWAPGSSWGWKPGESHHCHYALSVSIDALLAHIPRLNSHGIETIGFGGDPTMEPSVIGWMPSAQIYFKGPDGHTGEYIAILNDKPDPEFFGTWSEWQQRSNIRNTNK